MQKKLWMKLGLLMVIVGFLFVVSCAKKEVQPTPPTDTQEVKQEPVADDSAQQAEELERQRAEELATQQALEEEALKQDREKAAARELFVNEDVHFDYNESVLRFGAQEVLQKKAKWLQDNSDASVVIEGHCDERGSTEYNLALGDRRAESVRSFLVDLGIAKSRLTTISYGEEMPVDAANNEDAWAKNRRAHLTID